MTPATQPCGWPLPHRDKHPCSCTCRLAAGHDSRHDCCERQPAAEARS